MWFNNSTRSFCLSIKRYKRLIPLIPTNRHLQNLFTLYEKNGIDFIILVSISISVTYNTNNISSFGRALNS